MCEAFQVEDLALFQVEDLALMIRATMGTSIYSESNLNRSPMDPESAPKLLLQ